MSMENQTASNEKNGVSYKDLFEAEQKKRQEAEKDRDELLEKYNSVVQDREKVIASIQMVSVKAVAGMLSDLQSIARQAPRFEAMERG
ncbi:hypothetical protein NVIE_026900 [Nitrososphaera viennensis EN76]|uniref:Uncharacterized protein n=2 Tax=Nitrososphaera viennensis TaxID=1034015 RepID=A0A060HVA3_9ARCH|nr:hypothetical protein NVIE_026900 [Nitrososphaera viennensis EN76]